MLDFWVAPPLYRLKFLSASIEAVPQPTFPSPPSWGAGRSLRRMQGRRPGYKKSGIPRRISQTRVGSPEGRNSPLWCSFLHFSQEKWRPPAGTPPGRCAPRWVRAPTARRVRTAGGLAPRPHAAGLPCAKADGTNCPPPPQKDKDRLSPVFSSALEARPEGSVTHGGQAPGATGQALTCAASKWYGVPTPPRPRHKKGPGQPARSFLLRYCRVG